MEAVTVKSPSHAMDFQLESTPSTPYVSAPSSPCRTSFNDIPSSFYSAQGSPIRGLATSPIAWESGSGFTKSTQNDLDSDDFEFETCRRFEKSVYQQQQQQQQKVEQLPGMSFADELFCNGQVLPLKLPPRLQSASTRSYSVSASRSPSTVLYGPFPGWSFRNKDLDPFKVALEKVRKEETTRVQWTPHHRRTQSLSHLMSPQEDDHADGVQVQCQYNDLGHLESQVASVPIGPTKPQRSASQRVMGSIKLAPESQVNSTFTVTALAETETDTGETSTKVITRRWRSFPKGSRRRMVRDFLLLKSASAGRADPKDKSRDHTVSPEKTKDARKIPSFGPMQETHGNEKKSKHAAEDMRNKALVPHRQGLFVCLGFSSKGMKNMN